MTRLQRDDLLERVARLTGVRLEDDTTVERALVATLGELLAELPEVDRRALAAVLPHEYLTSRAHALSEGSPVQRVASRAALPRGLAREETAAVLRVLLDALSDEARTRLVRHLEPELRTLIQSTDAAHVEHVAPPVRPAAHPAPAQPRATLASGHPGSDHPLSEARPDVAHRHSVARSDEPHANTKLSSARGTTQERLHETLSEGGPPHPTRTIAGG